jgi:hypothetical protein
LSDGVARCCPGQANHGQRCACNRLEQNIKPAPDESTDRSEIGAEVWDREVVGQCE